MGDMINPDDPQGGEPNYIDKASNNAGSNFYPDKGNSEPAYVAGCRYKEYR